MTSVFVPTATASHRPRSAWTAAVAAALVIRTGLPCRPATLPSALTAHFSVTYGRSCTTRATNGAIICRHSASSTPVVTSTPAARSIATPRPFTGGLGSSVPTTTRATFAAISRGAHGGVFFPSWQHGSSVV